MIAKDRFLLSTDAGTNWVPYAVIRELHGGYAVHEEKPEEAASIRLLNFSPLHDTALFEGRVIPAILDKTAVLIKLPPRG